MGLLTVPRKVQSGSAWRCSSVRSGSGICARGSDVRVTSLACLTNLALDCVAGYVAQAPSATAHKATVAIPHARVRPDDRRSTTTSPHMTPLGTLAPLANHSVPAA